MISATLYRRSSGVCELVVAFDDNPGDIIETQLEPVTVDGLVQRANALRQTLLARGLTPVHALSTAV